MRVDLRNVIVNPSVRLPFRIELETEGAKMQFSPVPSYPAETEWSELRLTKCAQRAAPPCRQRPLAFA